MNNHNCCFCGKQISKQTPSGDYQNRSFSAGQACKECAILKEKELREVPMAVVSSCPNCGAPIYGVTIIRFGDLPCYSGNPFSPLSYSCSCRYRKSYKYDIDNINSKLEKLNQKLDSIVKVEIINSGIQQPKWYEFWKK